MIRTFADRQTARLWEEGTHKRLSTALARKAVLKLFMIDNAGRLGDLRVPPGNRLEALHGDRKGQHSIRINDQWRICFVWRENDAYEVQIVDYH